MDMTNDTSERFQNGWLKSLWSREPKRGAHRHSSREHSFRRELLGLLPRLRGHALALTGKPDQADDLMQDTCERALSRWQQWNGTGPLGAWVLRILYNRWRDHLRADSIRGSETLTENGVMLVSEDRSGDITELQQTLSAMEALSPEQRAVLLLVGVEGMSYRETAEVLDLPVGTVRSRVSRARSHLAEKLISGSEKTQ